MGLLIARIRLGWANLMWQRSLRKLEATQLRMLREPNGEARKGGVAIIGLTLGSPIESERQCVSPGVLRELQQMARKDSDQGVRSQAAQLLDRHFPGWRNS
jgi:hypothetical protein